MSFLQQTTAVSKPGSTRAKQCPGLGPRPNKTHCSTMIKLCTQTNAPGRVDIPARLLLHSDRIFRQRHDASLLGARGGRGGITTRLSLVAVDRHPMSSH